MLKINFSKKSLVVAATGQAIVSFFIQFTLVIILFVVYGFVPSGWIILLPIVMIPIVALSLGLGFILALLNGVIRDVSSILALIMTFLLFLTPVLYMKPSSGILATISDYNIIYYLIVGSRDLVLFGHISVLKGFLISTVISLAVFLVCLIVFHLTETRVAERI